MRIPEDKNTRAEEMWQIISKNVDFRNKRVIDLGCGTGDFIWRAYIAGAKSILGFDIEYSKIAHIKEWKKPLDISFMVDDLNKIIGESWFGFDIAMCFSVLPYLDDIPATIKWMADNFSLSLIEAQYDPEPYNIGVVSDVGMAQLLLNNGFSDVEPIGQSYVDYRDQWRTIWKCK